MKALQGVYKGEAQNWGETDVFKSQLLDALNYSSCLAAHGGAGQKSQNNHLLVGTVTTALAPMNLTGLSTFNTDGISLCSMN